MRFGRAIFRPISFMAIAILIIFLAIGIWHHASTNKSVGKTSVASGLPINYNNAPGSITLNNGMQQGNPNCELNQIDCPVTASSSGDSISQPSSTFGTAAGTSNGYRMFSTSPSYSGYSPSYLYFPPYTPTTVSIPGYTFPTTSSTPTPKYTYSQAYSLAQQNCNALLASKNAADSSALGACIQAELHNYGY